MKVAELRKILAAHKKEEIITLAVELYKLVPKSKKEDYDLDAVIENLGEKPVAVKAAPKGPDLATLEAEVNLFAENARAQNYLVPNRTVPKKERAGWRFLVKRWYKELAATSESDPDVGRKARILRELYDVLCESCGWRYFTAYDTFESVGVTQSEFYHAVLSLSRAAMDPGDFITVAINTMVNNELNRYTVYSNLMNVFIGFLPIPDMKNRAIETARKLLELHGYAPKSPAANKKTYGFGFDEDEYTLRKKNNNLAELVMRIHLSLHEYDEGIDYFRRNYQEKDPNITLYWLVQILRHHEAYTYIIREIDAARSRNVRIREDLVRTYDQIKDNGTLKS